MAVNIQLEWTPNPSTLKYVVNQSLLPSGAMQFTSKQAAEGKSPLVEKLFGIPGVTAVMLGSNFVTLTKGEEGDWDELNEAVMGTLEKHLGEGLPAFIGELPKRSSEGGPIEQQIREILEKEIRPAVMMDGGDIALDRFENGIVYLQMNGSCSGCPSSTMTLKMGIEGRLREAIPEVTEVVSV
jgi:Fe-S cluster biogenesis protein NfuA